MRSCARTDTGAPAGAPGIGHRTVASSPAPAASPVSWSGPP